MQSETIDLPGSAKRFTVLDLLQNTSEKFSFTKEIPVMKVNRIQRKTDEGFLTLENTKSALYYIVDDPGQLKPIEDKQLINKYRKKMINLIKDNDPPKELLSNYFNI